ncbi:MAG: hypothetical protein AB7S54_06905 [Bacteroidales bacterium]
MKRVNVHTPIPATRQWIQRTAYGCPFPTYCTSTATPVFGQIRDAFGRGNVREA